MFWGKIAHNLGQNLQHGSLNYAFTHTALRARDIWLQCRLCPMSMLMAHNVTISQCHEQIALAILIILNIAIPVPIHAKCITRMAFNGVLAMQAVWTIPHSALRMLAPTIATRNTTSTTWTSTCIRFAL